MAEKVAVKVPSSWKESLLSLRDTLPEDVGAELIAVLASRTPEQLGALVDAMQVEAAIAPMSQPVAIEGTPAQRSDALILPEPAPQSLLGRGVPYGLVGLLGKILDVALVDPSRARKALLRTEKLL